MIALLKIKIGKGRSTCLINTINQKKPIKSFMMRDHPCCWMNLGACVRRQLTLPVGVNCRLTQDTVLAMLCQLIKISKYQKAMNLHLSYNAALLLCVYNLA